MRGTPAFVLLDIAGCSGMICLSGKCAGVSEAPDATDVIVVLMAQ